jgi:phenylacetate-CoA ligase
MDEGARSLGCAVIPAGGGNTEQIIKAIVRYRPQAYTGTADYLRILMDAADQAGVTFTITKAALSGAALPASLRAAFAQRGIECYELYGTAELGIIAYETSAHTGLVVNEGMMVEIVEPGSGKPVAEGDVGEVVVTTLDEDYPLFRFATGDLSAFAAGLSGCGRSNQRLRGWLGRADETTKVKGMFVHPAHVRQLIDEYRTIVQRARFVIDREDERDVLTLEVETTENGVEIEERLAASIRAATRLGSKVRLCQPGELGQDPRSIIDRRVVG